VAETILLQHIDRVYADGLARRFDATNFPLCLGPGWNQFFWK
jgi:hypothetical protein